MPDLISDAMNGLMNAKRAGKMKISVPTSKFLIEVLEIMKKNNYLKDYENKEGKLIIEMGEFNECKSIRPRSYVKKEEIERFVRRFLPARDFGIIIVSTSKGLMIHKEAQDKHLGGSLIAYVY